MTDRVSLADLLYRVLEGSGPDRELDAEIARFLILAGAEDIARSRYGWSYFTASLDAAVTLYPVLPAVIPSCPRKASAAALRARSAAHD